MTLPSPIVVGCSGPELTSAERSFFRAANPLGFILFARNIVDPPQVKRLVSSLRASVGREDAPVLIDQEGGRVARLKPPHWRAAPPGGKIGAVVGTLGIDAACEAARINSQLLAAELAELGIDVDCLPVVDVPVAGAHDIIGDRAYSTDQAIVAKIACAAAEGLLAGGVLPVIKHIPGHGRARADSHAELPTVDEPLAVLDKTDFQAFRPLADMPWAMTAHVLYTAIDRDRPATTSPKLVNEIIRGSIGFKGVLVSDDLSMRALDGELPDRATAALAAGCDIVLHCTGVLEEMQAIARALPLTSQDAARRIAAASAMRAKPPASVDRTGLLARLDALLAGKAVS